MQRKIKYLTGNLAGLEITIFTSLPFVVGKKYKNCATGHKYVVIE